MSRRREAEFTADYRESFTNISKIMISLAAGLKLSLLTPFPSAVKSLTLSL